MAAHPDHGPGHGTGLHAANGKDELAGVHRGGPEMDRFRRGGLCGRQDGEG
jgi:hypothetical protein